MLIEAKEKRNHGSAEERFPGEYESRDTYTTQCDCRFLGLLVDTEDMEERCEYIKIVQENNDLRCS